MSLADPIEITTDQKVRALSNRLIDIATDRLRETSDPDDPKFEIRSRQVKSLAYAVATVMVEWREELERAVEKFANDAITFAPKV